MILNPKTKEAVLKIAESQVGVMESPMNSNKVKYNTWFYGKEVSGSAYPWCVVFIQWVFSKAGFSLFKTASCSAMVAQYKKVSPKQVVYKDYAVGDLVMFDFSGKKTKTEHIGIVIGVEGNNLITIEGNTGTNNANGGCVMKRTRNKNLVTCAIRPNYPA